MGARTKFLLHADDMGLSSGINRSISRSIDDGHVRSVSVIANGWAYDDAAFYLSARPDVRVTLHLNLLEGQPLSPQDSVPLLVDGSGRLATTFQKLALTWVRSGAADRHRLQSQIAIELGAQIRKGIATLGDRLDVVRVDSHTHIHALPFVLDAVLGLDLPRPIGYVRIPREPFHVSARTTDLRTMVSANVVKHVLLNSLAGRMTKRLSQRGIAHNPSMLGVLHTGAMTATSIEAGCRAVHRTVERDAEADDMLPPVEVLLHPGRADLSEEALWNGRPEMWAYYRSPNRERELHTATDARVGKLVT